MGHLVGAEQSVAGTPEGRVVAELPVWPELDLDSCSLEARPRSQVPGNRYMDEPGAGGPADGVGYRNTKGEFWTSSVADILTHVALHRPYHRGQIAAAVREAGGTPAYTDFIHAVRQRFVE